MPPSSRNPPTQPHASSDLAWLQWFSGKRPDNEKLGALVASSGRSWVGVDGCGPFTWAMRQQRKNAHRFVRALLIQGLDPDETQSEVSPLFEACYQYDLKSLKLLLGAGADPDVQGRTHPLGQACLGENRRSFVDELIKAGASIAPALRFDGIVAELGKGVDDFSRFRPGSIWNRLADTIASRDDASLWSEFSLQMKAWSADHGGTDFEEGVFAWLASKEASILLNDSVDSSFRASSRRF